MPGSYHAEYQGTHTIDDLRHGMTLHAFGHTWKPKPDDTMSLRLAHYEDAERGRAEFVGKLKEMDYRAPLWWEFWRWGERVPTGWQ